MTEPSVTQKPLPLARLGITGVFMGLANLVPGVSGGTMVLALGLYDEFINAMAAITRFKLNRRSITVLVTLFGLSALTILLFSSVIQFTMEMFRPGMLALFIGMTLGGAPSLIKELRPFRADAWISLAAGFALMASVALLMKPGLVTPTWPLLFVGGIIASSAMILPGISGSYMLLVMGLYLPVIAGVSAFKDALKAGDVDSVFSIGMSIGVPVALGIAIGIVGFSSLLKFMMERYHRPTLGFLLGLLLASVLGLYPFGHMSFDKLPRHAVPAAVAGAPATLNIMLYGEEGESLPVTRPLKALVNSQLEVAMLPTVSKEPTVGTIDAARAAKAVVIAYDLNVPGEVRAAADDKKAGKVQLIIVPNTEFTPLKALLCVVLAVVGFGATILLGRLGGEDKTPAPSPTA